MTRILGRPRGARPDHPHPARRATAASTSSPSTAAAPTCSARTAAAATPGWPQRLAELTQEERDVLRAAAPLLDRITRFMSPTFQSLRNRNYRLYATGGVVSNVGTWMQRVAQDWLVLQLSGHSGVALGITTGLQFLPMLLLAPFAGTLADRYSKRKVLIATQASMAVRRRHPRPARHHRRRAGLARLRARAAARRRCRLSTPRPGSPSSSRWSAATTCPTPSGSTARRSTSAASSARRWPAC